MAYLEQDRRSRLPSVAAVMLVHAGIGYAFLSGLAFDVIRRGPDIFRLIRIVDTPPPPPVEMRPPATRATRPATAGATVPDPMVRTDPGPVVIDVQPMTETITPDTGPVIALPPSDPVIPAARPVAARALGDRTRWIDSDDYPPAALRGGAEGTVGIAVQIGQNGRVRACAVTASSGHVLLDEATCRLYTRRARFAPASEGGQPVTATVHDRITWRLPR